MRTLLKNSIIIALIFLTGSIYSQESKYVELTLSDTITLKCTKIIYQINLGQQIEFMGIKMPMDKKHEESEPTPSISDLTKILDKEKFVYIVSLENDYSISGSPNLPTTFVTLNTEKDLKRLYNVLQTQKGISGKIKEVSYEPLSKYDQVVYKSLYDKAKNQASLIASISGNTIGTLLSATNVSNQPDNMEIYKQMFKNMPIGFLNGAQIPSKKEEVKMVFKFALK